MSGTIVGKSDKKKALGKLANMKKSTKKNEAKKTPNNVIDRKRGENVQMHPTFTIELDENADISKNGIGQIIQSGMQKLRKMAEEMELKTEEDEGILFPENNRDYEEKRVSLSASIIGYYTHPMTVIDEALGISSDYSCCIRVRLGQSNPITLKIPPESLSMLWPLKSHENMTIDLDRYHNIKKFVFRDIELQKDMMRTCHTLTNNSTILTVTAPTFDPRKLADFQEKSCNIITKTTVTTPPIDPSVSKIVSIRNNMNQDPNLSPEKEKFLQDVGLSHVHRDGDQRINRFVSGTVHPPGDIRSNEPKESVKLESAGSEKDKADPDVTLTMNALRPIPSDRVKKSQTDFTQGVLMSQIPEYETDPTKGDFDKITKPPAPKRGNSANKEKKSNPVTTNTEDVPKTSKPVQKKRPVTESDASVPPAKKAKKAESPSNDEPPKKKARKSKKTKTKTNAKSSSSMDFGNVVGHNPIVARFLYQPEMFQSQLSIAEGDFFKSLMSSLGVMDLSTEARQFLNMTFCVCHDLFVKQRRIAKSKLETYMSWYGMSIEMDGQGEKMATVIEKTGDFYTQIRDYILTYIN
jgi:hypothetical protein